MPKNVLDSFSYLRKKSGKEQIKATVNIVKHLIKEQGSREDPSNELALAIRRIIRGLGAPTSSSRVGFFTVFSALPVVFSTPIFTLDMCQEVMEKELVAYSKEEKADVLKGIVLVCSCLIFSNKIKDANGKQVTDLLKKLLSIRNNRSYLKLSVHVCVVELLKRVTAGIFVKHVWPHIRDEIIETDKNSRSLMFYHLLLILNKTYPNVVNDEYLSSLLGARTVINENNVGEISHMLMNVDRIRLMDSPMYTDLLEGILESVSSVKAFWKVVNSYLKNGTQSKASLALKLFTYFVSNMKNKNWVRHLLKDHIVLMLVNDLDEDINKLRLIALKTFADAVKGKDLLNSNTLKVVIQKLLFFPGNFRFANMGGKQVILSLVNNLDEENVKYLVQEFLNVLNDKSSKTVLQKSNEKAIRPWKENQKKAACMAINRLLLLPAVEKSIDWKVSVLKNIIDHAFFIRGHAGSVEKAAQSCLYQTLYHKFHKLDDQKLLLKQLVFIINEKLISNNYTSINRTDKFTKAWKEIIDFVKSLDKKKVPEENSVLVRTVFEMMFLLLAVMLICDVDGTEPIIKELFSVYDVAMKMLTQTKDENNEKNQSLCWTDVLIDLILSLLSNESRIHRNILNQIFIYLCPYLTSNNINQILKVLNPLESNILVRSDDEESDDDSDDDTNNKQVSKKGNDDIQSGSDVDSDSDSDLEEDIDENEKDLELLRSDVFEALKSTANDDEGSVDLNDMSEDEGKRLDESLSAAFRKIKMFQKKTVAAEEKQLNVLRTRALDLLEIYMKTNPDLENLIDIMVTCLMLLENSVSNPNATDLHNRLRSFIGKLTSVKKFTCKNKLQINQLVNVLKKIIDKGERTSAVYVEMKNEIVDCCTFILKLSLKNKKRFKKLNPFILEIYLEALKRFFTRRNNNIPIGLFNKALSLQWAGAFTLGDTIANFLNDEDIRSYDCTNALTLLRTLFNNGRIFTPEYRETYDDVIKRIVSQLKTNTIVFQNLPLKKQNEYKNLINFIQKFGLANDVEEINNVDSLKKNKKLKKSKRENDVIEINKNDKNLVEEKSLQDNETSDNGNELVGSPDKTLSKTGQRKLKRKRALMEKKLTKIRRYESASEGLVDGVFGTHMSENMEFIHGTITPMEEEQDDN